MAQRKERAQVELESFMQSANLSAFTTVVQGAFHVRHVRDLGALTDEQLVRCGPPALRLHAGSATGWCLQGAACRERSDRARHASGQCGRSAPPTSTARAGCTGPSDEGRGMLIGLDGCRELRKRSLSSVPRRAYYQLRPSTAPPTVMHSRPRHQPTVNHRGSSMSRRVTHSNARQPGGQCCVAPV